MIDEQRTLEIYGYVSSDLKTHSHKPIVSICDICGKYRDVLKSDYRDLCKSCAATIRNKKRYEDPAERTKTSDTMKKHWADPDARKIQSDTIKKYYEDPRERERQRVSHIGSLNGMYGIHRYGEDSPCWKGGITSWSRAYHNSTQHKIWRTEVFERDNYTCQMCGDDKGGNLQAHHIEPIRDNKNNLLIFDINNGITLCEDCHRKTFGREYDFIEQFENIVENTNNTDKIN